MHIKIKWKAFLKSRKYPHMYKFYLWRYFYESIGFIYNDRDIWYYKKRIKITQPDVNNEISIINYDSDDVLVFKGIIYNFKEFKFIFKRVIK